MKLQKTLKEMCYLAKKLYNDDEDFQENIYQFSRRANRLYKYTLKYSTLSLASLTSKILVKAQFAEEDKEVIEQFNFVRETELMRRLMYIEF